MTNLKKGEQKMEGILHARPVNFDSEKYAQSIELKIQDLYNRGENAKVIVYRMFKQNVDINLISQVTGLTFDEIDAAIEEIDPEYYQGLLINRYYAKKNQPLFEYLDNVTKQKTR